MLKFPQPISREIARVGDASFCIQDHCFRHSKVNGLKSSLSYRLTRYGRGAASSREPEEGRGPTGEAGGSSRSTACSLQGRAPTYGVGPGCPKSAGKLSIARKRIPSHRQNSFSDSPLRPCRSTRSRQVCSARPRGIFCTFHLAQLNSERSVTGRHAREKNAYRLPLTIAQRQTSTSKC